MFNRQFYYIKKWYNMIAGKSVSHAPQGLGTVFVPDRLSGYFNDLSNKVKMQPQYLKEGVLPTVIDDNGKEVFFPVAIFQYGLGAYDLYLETKEYIYYNKFIECASWAIKEQHANGAWDNFSMFSNNIPPFGAMCQGEGASLLLRAYIRTGLDEYLEKAKLAIDFMLESVDEGGTAIYNEEDIIFLEYTNKTPVLNGWIFSIFGLYDMLLVEPSNEKYQTILDRTIKTLEKNITKYDCGYWSMYDLDGNIASPFYHNLHIAQLTALDMVFDSQITRATIKRFGKYKSNMIFFIYAFMKKAVQKIKKL